MRILHTADWHLGHTLRDHSREREHEHFLHWLVDTIADRKVDALLIAGDVFDSANPPPASWRLWFEFLGALERRRPSVQVVVIAGNHDSPARLEAPRDLLAAFGVHVIGRIECDANGRLRADELLVPLAGPDGETAVLCAAIPFLRAGDVMAFAAEDERQAAVVHDCVIPRPGEAIERARDVAASEASPVAHGAAGDADPLIEGMRVLHRQLFDAARARRRPGQALVAVAHGYLVGGMLSELSERKVLGGNQHALPVDLFPDDCAYIALGHLHRPQPVAGRDNVRYCGSPIPLSMPEREHAHHVVFADFEGETLTKTWSLRVPRLVTMLRIPECGHCEPDRAFEELERLPPRDDDVDEELRPLLEVAVRLAEPAPSIGERIANVCAGKNVRLARIDVTTTAADSGEHEGGRRRELASLAPEELFRLRYAREHEGEVPAALLAAFRELLEEVEDELGGSP